MVIRNGTDPEPPRRRWPRLLFASAVVGASLLMLVPPVVLSVTQAFFLDHRQFANLILTIPTAILAYPGVLGAFVLSATVVDFLLRRGWKTALRWLPAFLFLNVLLCICYWIHELHLAVGSGGMESALPDRRPSQ